MIVELSTDRLIRKHRRVRSFIPPFSVGVKCTRENCHGDLVHTPKSIGGDTRPVVTCLLCGREYTGDNGHYCLSGCAGASLKGRGSYRLGRVGGRYE
ncbi:hypothetical protein ES705_38936 [subsurface metagenome]